MKSNDLTIRRLEELENKWAWRSSIVWKIFGREHPVVLALDNCIYELRATINAIEEDKKPEP